MYRNAWEDGLDLQGFEFLAEALHGRNHSIMVLASRASGGFFGHPNS